MEKLNVFGVLFVSHRAFSYGDYDNSSAIERANCRYLLAQHEGAVSECLMRDVMPAKLAGEFILEDSIVSDLSNHYSEMETRIAELHNADLIHSVGRGSYQVWIREDIDEANDYVSSVSDYSELDDATTCEVENELFESAMESWIESDVRSMVVDLLDEHELELSDDCDMQNEIVVAMGELCIAIQFECADAYLENADLAAIADHIAERIIKGREAAERAEAENIRTQGGRQVEMDV